MCGGEGAEVVCAGRVVCAGESGGRLCVRECVVGGCVCGGEGGRGV